MAYNNHLKIPFSKTQMKAVSTDGVLCISALTAQFLPSQSCSLSSKGFSAFKK